MKHITEKINTNRNMGAFYVIASAILFGLMPLFTKMAYQYGSNAYSAAFGRFFFGSLILLVMILIKPGVSLRLERNQLLHIFVLSLFYAAMPVLLYESYHYMSSSLATTLHFTYPVMVIVIMTLFFGNKINIRQISCTVLCIIGIALMCNPGDKAYTIGIALAVISGLAYSFYIVFLGKSNLHSVPALALSFWLSLFSAVEIGIAAMLTGKMSFAISWKGWTAEFMLALFCTVFALILFQRGLFLCGEIKASLLSTFEPITSVVVGVIVFNENITLKITLGIAAVLLSTILLVAKKDRSYEGESIKPTAVARK